MVVSYAPKTYMANILDQKHFDFDFDGVLGQVWYLIVSIPDLCTLTYFLWMFHRLNITTNLNGTLF